MTSTTDTTATYTFKGRGEARASFLEMEVDGFLDFVTEPGSCVDVIDARMREAVIVDGATVTFTGDRELLSDFADLVISRVNGLDDDNERRVGIAEDPEIRKINRFLIKTGSALYRQIIKALA